MDAHSLVIIALCALVGYGVVSFSIARFRQWSHEKTQQNGNQERGDANEPPTPNYQHHGGGMKCSKSMPLLLLTKSNAHTDPSSYNTTPIGLRDSARS
jgi:hypothetical protein